MFELDCTPKGHLSIETVVNGPLDTNTYFVGSAGAWVAIDPAWRGERLVEGFRRAHPEDRLLGVVCTHGHADHVGGVAGIRSVLGEEAFFALPAKDIDIPAENIAEQRSMWGIETPDPGSPTRLLNEGDLLEVGDCVLQVMETPGHTKGGVIFFAATLDGNFAFVGDTLFPGGHGRTDFSGGSNEAILDSLARMARLLPRDVTCLIGHGPSTTMAAERASNPYMA